MDKHDGDVVTPTFESGINASANATMKFTTEESIMAYRFVADFCFFLSCSCVHLLILLCTV
jgi:hypothetical protein